MIASTNLRSKCPFCKENLLKEVRGLMLNGLIGLHWLHRLMVLLQHWVVVCMKPLKNEMKLAIVEKTKLTGFFSSIAGFPRDAQCESLKSLTKMD